MLWCVRGKDSTWRGVLAKEMGIQIVVSVELAQTFLCTAEASGESSNQPADR